MTGVAEQLEGVGKILKDDQELGEVFYSISVRKAGRRGWSYPFARFRRRGHLDVYDLVGEPITLVLDDGRRWNCRLQSLDGTVVPIGDWPLSEGSASTGES